MQEPQGAAGTYLVVDDEDTMRDVLILTLQAGGYDCIAAANGMEALAVFERETEIAGVITDLRMPYMDGVTLIRCLRELQPGLPIVVVSGQVTAENRKEIEECGDIPILMKPFTVAQLLEQLDHGNAVRSYGAVRLRDEFREVCQGPSTARVSRGDNRSKTSVRES
jgi:two-component system, cell cycle sensor histidine kinase and response regulator CckA